MSNSDERVNRHAAELARLTMNAADQGEEPLPEQELADLGKLIAIERQLLIDAMGELLLYDEPTESMGAGVAEFDAGFAYGLAFARALDDAKLEIGRVRRGRILRLAKGRQTATAEDIE
jgi:hypothetical protein